MLKFKIIIILFLFITELHSQESNYFIKYNYYINLENNDVKKNETVSKYLELAKKGSETITFSLKANANFSEFVLENSGILNEEEKIAIIFSNYIGKCTYDINKKINYIKVDEESIFKKNEFIIKDTLVFDWEITTETKKISEYECIKAIKNIPKSKSDSRKDTKVVAWFCPKLAINIGPNGYSGLPGLILELNINNIAFVASKVVKKETEELIEIPKIGKYISYMEYNEIMRSRMLKFQD